MNTKVSPHRTDGPVYEVVDITPELAREWIKANTHNRNLRQRVVNGYAADMAAGAWAEDGQSIKFSATGVLLDGQHRLAAIVQSGATVRMLVVRNLPDHTQDTMDTGAKRAFGDVLKLRGEDHAITLAAVLLRVYQWEQGFRRNLKSAGGARPTHRQLLDVLAEHPEVRRSVEVADRVRKTGKLSGSTAGLCHWVFAQIDYGDCTFFFGRLGDGVALMGDDPIYALRRALDNLASDRGRPDDAFVTALVIKSWNAYREGRSLQVLSYRAGGTTPEQYPEPK